jgi:hypothetical protein
MRESWLFEKIRSCMKLIRAVRANRRFLKHHSLPGNLVPQIEAGV